MKNAWEKKKKKMKKERQKEKFKRENKELKKKRSVRRRNRRNSKRNQLHRLMPILQDKTVGGSIWLKKRSNHRNMSMLKHNLLIWKLKDLQMSTFAKLVSKKLEKNKLFQKLPKRLPINLRLKLNSNNSIRNKGNR